MKPLKRGTPKKIQLVTPPLSADYQVSSKAGAYAPLALATLATYVRSRLPQTEIEILDGEILSNEEILANLGADIVGISCGILNYEPSLLIGDAAAEKGCKVIYGGPYPSSIPERILSNRPQIDGVVVGDGEEALCHLLETPDHPEEIPNLVYRERNSLRHNRRVVTPLRSLPILSYAGCDISQYVVNFTASYPSKPFHGSLAIASTRGCLWRAVSGGGCIYCALPFQKFVATSPWHFWEEVKNLHEAEKIDFFWDVSDTFTRPTRRLQQLLQCKPRDLDVSFLVYGRSDDINEAMAGLLRRIGVYEIFLGVESGNDTILNASNRGQASASALVAVRTLAKQGIKAIVSFQVGLPGDNEETCHQSLTLARELGETGNVSEVFSSMLLPIPGTRAFSMLMQSDDLRNKYSSLDVFPLEEIRKDFVSRFCGMSYEALAAVRDELMSYFPRASSLGKPTQEAYNDKTRLETRSL